MIVEDFFNIEYHLNKGKTLHIEGEHNLVITSKEYHEQLDTIGEVLCNSIAEGFYINRDTNYIYVDPKTCKIYFTEA